ncbi:MAG TPA: pyridoxamine 5'-phosphate oxidase family protein [Kofleriaceae bacterium]|jgi:general stress protein 26|nr:pyridoxamine 5'-phosphate oxidase family protein [Kofleriaceae bacterium]
MTSINQQQPEDNRADLRGDEALAKMRELVDQGATCFFCTAITSGQPVPTRPMSVQQVDDQGRLWFLSASDSHQNSEIVHDAAVQLLFQGSHSDFLTLYGRATVSTDRAKIKELWRPILKTWFTEGPDDPRITVLSVEPSNGYYWDTKHNRAVVLAKMIAGAITGKTFDDSIEGTIRV